MDEPGLNIQASVIWGNLEIKLDEDAASEMLAKNTSPQRWDTHAVCQRRGQLTHRGNGQSGTRSEQAVSNHVEMLEKGPVDFTGLVSIFSPSWETIGLTDVAAILALLLECSMSM